MKIYLLYPDSQSPTYVHATDSGMDLYAYHSCLIPPNEWRLIGTGIAIALDQNTEAQIRPRSGLSLNYGIGVLNSPGTIDEGYSGEVKVILINNSSEYFQVSKGMKIAQMVISPVIRPVIDVSRSQPKSSDRGLNGFGSSGLS